MPARRASRRIRHAHGAHVELLEAEAVLLHLAASAGIVPNNASRAPFDHELAARVNFAGLEADDDDLARLVAGRMATARAELIAEIDARLAADMAAGGTRNLRGILDELGNPAIRSTIGAETTARLVDAVRLELEEGAAAGYARLLSEARAQGVPFRPSAFTVGDRVEEVLDAGAIRLGRLPLERISREVLDAGYSLPVFDMTPDEVRAAVRGRLEGLSDAPELDAARQEAHRATGLGRQQAAEEVPTPARIYASELLDRNTCGPCSLVDGREYGGIEAATADYPTGRYRNCLGGDRCRGTLVCVWPEEAEPTIGPDDDLPGALPPEPGPGAPEAAGDTFEARLDRYRAQRPDVWAPISDEPFDARGFEARWRADKGRAPTMDEYRQAEAAHAAARLTVANQHEELVRAAGRVIDTEAQRRLALLGPDPIEGQIATARAELAEAEALYTSARGRMRNLVRGTDEWAEAADASNAAALELRRLRPLVDELEAAAGQRSAAVYREVLGEVQEMGAGGLRHRYASGSVKAKGTQPLEEALELMPRRWVEASVRHADEVQPLYVGNIERGHYKPTDYRRVKGNREVISRLNVSGTGSDALRVATHEFGHRIEHVLPEVRRLEHAFYRRRTLQADGTLEPRKWMGPGYGRDEVARPDKFENLYMGKDYGNRPDSFYELLSMGLEGIYRGRYNGLDEDMRSFILGLLAMV